MVTAASRTQRINRAVPTPGNEERPTALADRVGERYAASRSVEHRKRHGLYLTPVAVADYMASRIEAPAATMRLLDPAAGTGVLCCAAVESLVVRNRVAAIQLVACEVDSDLIPLLRGVLDYLTAWCKARSVKLDVHIDAKDFITSYGAALQSVNDLFRSIPKHEFDVVIANPPYFKIGKSDPRAAAASSVVHGQPNIYALFMAVGAALLRESGAFVYIVPRSFASGPYFRRFRATFFNLVQPNAVHVFGSRRSAFSRDEVLQENVIFCGTRRNRSCKRNVAPQVTITASQGVADLGMSTRRNVSASTTLDINSPEKVLRLPVSRDEESILRLVDRWPNRLCDLGLSISTGPVVPFRARHVVCAGGDVPDTHAPLLWMNHIHAMRVTWPLNRHKDEYICRDDAAKLLVPNRNYVVIRRFSAKEEQRRLTAAPLLAHCLESPDIGLENHLNYIHRPGGSLSEDECWGLAALYNSSLLDTYFRCVSGNTQASATELRHMPLPHANVIHDLGGRAKQLTAPMVELDNLVSAVVLTTGASAFG